MRLDETVREVLPQVVELRHTLHAHPELAFEEHQTAETVVRHLRSIEGLEVQMQVGGTAGIRAVLNGHKPGKAVLLRADMDALPIQEESDLPYRSTVAGKMHACGHDGHTACLVGTAMVLSRMADELPGPVVFVFQPAEESLGGGRLLVEAEVLKNPDAGVAFALHGWPQIPLGRVGLYREWSMAATGGFQIVVKARGGHGAAPHETPDPIVVAARIVDGLQTIASRIISPIKPVVVTVGTIHGGTAVNIIPNRVEMTGTVRALQDDVRAEVLRHIERIATHTAAAFGTEVEVTTREAYPAVYNDPAVCEFIAGVSHEVLGPGSAIDSEPVMGGEDFSYYLQRVPGAMIRLGVDAPGRPCQMLHTSRYDFNDDALSVGMRLFAGLTRRWLERQAKG